MTDSLLEYLSMFPVDPNWLVAAFTLLLALIAYRANQHFRVSERAYVKLSHRPPGLYFEFPARQEVLYHHNRTVWVRCDLRVKNFGKTPSSITTVTIAHKIAAVGKNISQPAYNNAIIINSDAFLVCDDEFTQPYRAAITHEEFDAILRGESLLFLFANVEYTDKFKARHRGTYARRYVSENDLTRPVTIRTGEDLPADEHNSGRNNLAFINMHGFNSDLNRNLFGRWK